MTHATKCKKAVKNKAGLLIHLFECDKAYILQQFRGFGAFAVLCLPLPLGSRFPRSWCMLHVHLMPGHGRGTCEHNLCMIRVVSCSVHAASACAAPMGSRHGAHCTASMLPWVEKRLRTRAEAVWCKRRQRWREREHLQ